MLLSGVQAVFGQDIQLSQFYAAPLYLSPGFAGSAHQGRAMFHQRLQWPRMDAKYITSIFSYDTYLSKYNSGVGVMVIQDIQGANTISSTDLMLQYAYEIHFGQGLTFRPGIQLGLTSRNINYANLRFPSQYNNNGYQGGGSIGFGEAGSDRIHYADATLGGVLYSERFWVGATGHHLNQPNQSFTAEEAKLPIKWSFVTGYKIPVIKNKYKSKDGTSANITPVVHYKMQGRADQMDVGVYGNYNQFMAGILYRGLPYLKRYQAGLHNNESMIATAGWGWDNFVFGYSYDFTVSRLAPAQTGGSHELNITYLVGKTKRKKMRRIPCPNIYDR